jgi:hypothetical protein
MIKVNSNQIMRDGTKIGWITDNHFFNHMGDKVGYITSDMVFDKTAKEVAHLEGEYVYYPGNDKREHVEDIISNIEAPILSNIQRVAIRIFFGN